jgi:hypothetical protein
MIEHLPSQGEALSSNPSITKKKMKNRKVKQVLSRGGCPGVGGGGHKERVKKDKYSGYILYLCMKIK